MSVLVRGMDMPKNCYSCNFCQYYTEVNQGCYCVALFADLHRTDFVKERLASCPLIEVSTPHGRLIDADSLRLLYDFNGYKPTGDMTEEEFDNLMCRLPVIRQNIDDMPTIIESEE